VSLTYRATVDVPARFRKSKAVGAVFGLTCAKYQSGEVEWSGRISRCGDEMMRVMLYEVESAVSSKACLDRSKESLRRHLRQPMLLLFEILTAREGRFLESFCAP